jgi:hypothetical protein
LGCMPRRPCDPASPVSLFGPVAMPHRQP